MYQKCPICNGSGVDQVSAYTGKDPKCLVCNGKRIINEITGKPPNNTVAEVCACVRSDAMALKYSGEKCYVRGLTISAQR